MWRLKSSAVGYFILINAALTQKAIQRGIRIAMIKKKMLIADHSQSIPYLLKLRNLAIVARHVA